MIKLTAEAKRAVYNGIMSQERPIGRYGEWTSYEDLNVVDFLKLIWDLPTMPSEDARFRNAEADAHQHMVNNADWTLEDALLRRFNLLAGDQEYFIRFVEAIVSPEVRGTKDEIEKYVSLINAALNDENCELVIKDYIKELPCYRLMEGRDHETIVNDLRPNTIRIYVNEDPKEYPSVKLVEYPWDDYGYKTRYLLFYYPKEDQCHKIGRVKIMKRDERVTYGSLPSGVFFFGKDYCSLGQTLDYYESIKDLLGGNYKNFLYAMRDAAVFSKICDEFNESSCFKNSLLRSPEAEDALQFVVYKLAGYSAKEASSFTFKAKMPYAQGDYLSIKFDMGKIQDNKNLNRVIALIGNNGVGKTTVLSQLAEAIVKGKDDLFEPHSPIFKKVISASYSIFDKFFNIEGSSFNYTYCGIQTKTGRLMSPEEIATRRSESIKLVNSHDRKWKLHKYIEMLLPFELTDNLFDKYGKFDEKKCLAIHDKLSSGQSMLMNLIIEIVANIRQNTLILLDEPEVHLHPKGITTIITILNLICKEFSSCCVLATHSSVIVQELLSRNVIVMDRQEDGTPIVRPMRVESFGENLTTITEDVFGRSQVSPYYKKVVKDLVKENDSIENVLRIIQNQEVPISMPLYMLIDKYFSEK